ncbi:PAS domain S-box protein [Chlorobium sp. BLA1]|uniref:transcriptional regulator n=1 Tax=Candidatus Chlorobium masyuteum TaxID=2716876 RepID=UPI00141F9441|nr:transcriptional regulator [Candidatus Chlorobium masyuteum]NHQ60361.1 PAS domain S-box protein [Candidatus Chlorobium masyuteum]
MKKGNAHSAHFSELRKQAEALLNTGARKYPDFSHSHEEMQRVVHELAVHQIELEMQQDELLQTRTDLEESLECYTELFDFAPLAYLTLSANGKIRQVNLTGTKLLGIDRSKLIGDRFGRFIAPDDLPVFNDFLATVFSQHKSCSCEVRLGIDAGNTVISRNSFASPDESIVPDHHIIRIDAIQSPDGKECRAVVSDISMQKLAEREQSARKKTVIHTPGSGVSNKNNDTAPDFNHQLIDKVIHARIRFAALSYLFSVDQACFVEIKKKVHTSDGNLSVHLRMLESAEYISCDKDLQARKPQTIYSITQKGHDAFVRYKESITGLYGT